MELIVAFGFVAIVVAGVSIKVKVRNLGEQNKEIIELLKQIKEK